MGSQNSGVIYLQPFIIDAQFVWKPDSCSSVASGFDCLCCRCFWFIFIIGMNKKEMNSIKYNIYKIKKI